MAIAREMVEGALAHSRAQAVFAITGVAGPTGGTPDKPVGTVCFGWAVPGEAIEYEDDDGTYRDADVIDPSWALAVQRREAPAAGVG